MKRFGRGNFAKLVFAVAAAVVWSAPAAAQSVADFYKGANVTMLIGSGAGGGYDTYSRVLARHMGRHIPGEPHIVPKNMPGGGSIKATNFLYNVAPKDGLVFAAIFNTIPLLPLVGTAGVKFDVRRLGWLGSIGKHQNICATWHASPIKTFEQAKTRQVVVAATGASGNAAVYPTIFNEVLGTKFKVVTGYKASEARLAVTRGEADGICGMSYQTLLASDPAWIRDRRITILAQIGLEPHPALPGVPMALDMMKNEADRNVLTFLMVPQEMGRPYVAPPDLPAARIAALRSAFMATMKDPAFIADAEKVRMKIEPIDHAAMDALVARLYAMPQETVARARKLLRPGKKAKR